MQHLRNKTTTGDIDRERGEIENIPLILLEDPKCWA